VRLSGASLRRRLGATLLVLGLVQLVVVSLALVALLQVREDQQRLTVDLFRVLQDSNAGFSSVVEVQDAALGYLATGGADELERLQVAQAPRQDAVDADLLASKLRDTPDAAAALEQVRQVAQEWLGALQPLAGRVEAGGPDAVTSGEVRELRRLFEQVRSSYDAYVAEVLVARDDAFDSLQLSSALLFGAVLLAVATSVAAGLVLFAALRRWVTRPLTELGQETRAVRTGALGHVVVGQGPPEIVALADDVEAMRRELVSQLAEVERAQRRLERQAADLQRSNRDLEQFAYVASHDLQEPLRKVSSFCQLLQRRYQGELDERADQYIEFAVDGAKRMQLLINDLLAFSRVGRMADAFVDVELDGVLAEVLRTLSTRVTETRAVVTSDPLPVVPGERRLLVQLLQNLIGNALKFSGDAPPRVHLSAQQREDAWELAVSDDGIGIEPQYAERIFVIFQRLHPKTEYEGTGIGLSLCKKIVEHHGGQMWLDTEAASGATFRFTLPMQPPALADEQVDDAPEGAREERAWSRV
jgi:signal transduction histidine kinase